ncbi:hypothetical protein D3C75_730510 [compost metagenome]
MVGFRRFLDEYVKGCSGHNACIDRFHQSGFVDNAAAGAVDDAHTLLHHFELGAADNIAGIVGQRCMHGNEVGVADDLIHCSQLHTDFFCALVGHEGVEADDVHTEGFGAFGNLTADPAHADNAQHLVAQLHTHEGFAVPFPAYGFLVRLGNHPGEAENMTEGQLAGGDGVAVRRIHNNDAAFGGGFQIDVVHAYTGAADNLQVFGGFHHSGVDLGLAADHHGIIVGDDFHQHILGHGGLDVHLNIGSILKQLNTLIADSIQYQYFYHFRFPPVYVP